MKLWLDAQLPPAIAGWIASTFGVECEHIRNTAMAQADDQALFAALRRPGQVIVTKDEDFADLVTHLNPPPQALWVRVGNLTNQGLREFFGATLRRALDLPGPTNRLSRCTGRQGSAPRDPVGAAVMRTLLLAGLLPVACARSPECAMLLDHVDSVRIGIGLYAVGDGPENAVKGLRGLSLHQGRGIRGEPHAMWLDGSPASADAQVSKDAMRSILVDFESLGVWKDAELFWSEARPNPTSPPPVAERFRGGMTVRPSCGVSAVYTSGEYHVHVVRWVPWGEETARLLGRLASRVPLAGDLATSFERLRQQG